MYVTCQVHVFKKVWKTPQKYVLYEDMLKLCLRYVKIVSNIYMYKTGTV